jgi:hypothetical protein
MASISDSAHGREPLRLGRRLQQMPAEVWPSLAISVMWLAVLFDSLFGPSIETSDGAGTNTSSVPSAVVVALFAWLATWVVARAAFRRDAAR